ncbi:hypothetical protein HK101_007917 [Irineochytrium annulatum]|nr:hypothetical protein HK101_007917 [Irineochytrium annulatum]
MRAPVPNLPVAAAPAAPSLDKKPKRGHQLNISQYSTPAPAPTGVTQLAAQFEFADVKGDVTAEDKSQPQEQTKPQTPVDTAAPNSLGAAADVTPRPSTVSVAATIADQQRQSTQQQPQQHKTTFVTRQKIPPPPPDRRKPPAAPSSTVSTAPAPSNNSSPTTASAAMPNSPSVVTPTVPPPVKRGSVVVPLASELQSRSTSAEITPWDSQEALNPNAHDSEDELSDQAWGKPRTSFGAGSMFGSPREAEKEGPASARDKSRPPSRKAFNLWRHGSINSGASAESTGERSSASTSYPSIPMVSTGASALSATANTAISPTTATTPGGIPQRSNSISSLGLFGGTIASTSTGSVTQAGSAAIAGIVGTLSGLYHHRPSGTHTTLNAGGEVGLASSQGNLAFVELQEVVMRLTEEIREERERRRAVEATVEELKERVEKLEKAEVKVEAMTMAEAEPTGDDTAEA